MTIDQLEAAALAAFNAHNEGIAAMRAAMRLGAPASLANVPSYVVRCGVVRAEIIDVNGSVKRDHTRVRFYINGKKATRQAAAEALG